VKKRNKKTTIVSEPQLSKLTEYILSRMGEEGLIIRRRLQEFLEDRSTSNPANWQEQLEKIL
jgi:hypothetical protein